MYTTSSSLSPLRKGCFQNNLGQIIAIIIVIQGNNDWTITILHLYQTQTMFNQYLLLVKIEHGPITILTECNKDFVIVHYLLLKIHVPGGYFSKLYDAS